MAYEKGYTLDSTPGGDTVKEAIIDKLDALAIDRIFSYLNSHEALTTGIHGVGAGAIVGTTLTQTLTNKTLTTPTIGSFVNATHIHQAAESGGTLDHGAALTGLSDDDHTQYALVSGTRSFTGNVTINKATSAALLVQSGTREIAIYAYQADHCYITATNGQMVLHAAGSNSFNIWTNSVPALSIDGSQNLTYAGAIINLSLTQASIRLTNTTRTWDLQSVTSGDYFRLLIGGVGDGIKVDSSMNLTVGNNLTVSGLTASKAIKTNSSKVLTSGNLDHGLDLDGLSDNDHTIYARSGPCFFASKGSDQDNITTTTDTKITFTTENFDSDGTYDATNSKWTPGKVGYWLITFNVYFHDSPADSLHRVTLYKNGVSQFHGGVETTSHSIEGACKGTMLVSTEAVTDYFELYIWTTAAGNVLDINGVVSLTWWAGCPAPRNW